jgi:peptidyl-prolyl cis-trans isomerase D
MMRTMRASAKWIMGVVAFFFVGWMIYGYGMDIVGRGSAAPNIVGKVNGHTIDAQSFYSAVRNEQERRRQDSLPPATTLAEQRQLEDAVFEQIVQEIVMQDEFRRRHISVSDQEIIEAARTTPPPEVLSLPQFQTDGKFDFQKYQRFIASSVDPQFLIALEDRYRNELPRIKLYQQLVAGVYVSDAELWQDFRDRNDSVTIVTLELRPHAVSPDSVANVTEAEAQAYYDAHQDDFKRPAAAYLSYLALSRVPNAADSAAALERVRALRKEIVDGASFADVASRESADSVSRAKGGDLGDAKPTAFVPEFSKVAMALRPGQVSEPFETQFGWHLVQLESKTDSTFHARHILIPIEPAGDHLKQVESRADTLDLFAAEQEDPLALSRVADELGLPLAQAPPLYQGRTLQLGMQVIPDAGVWAFGGVQAGETSPVIETQPAYYVFRLDSLTPAGIPPLSQVREEVATHVREQKQQQALAALAAKVKQELDGGATMEAEAKKYDLVTRTLGPFTRYNPVPALQGAPEVAGAAFGLSVGRIGGPITTPFATYFVRPTKHVIADSTAFLAQKDALRSAAIQRAQQNRVQLILSSIREAAKVDDRRAQLEEAQKKASAQAPATQTPRR